MSDKTEQALNILPLSYALSLLSQFLPVPTHIFKADNHYFEKFDSGGGDDWNVLKTDFEFRREILETVRREGVALYTREHPVIFGGVQCTDDLTLVIGPVATSEVDQNFSRLYALKHNAANVSLYKCDSKKIASFVLLIYSSVSGKYIYLSDFLDKYLISNDTAPNADKQIAQVFNRQLTESRPHNPGSFEESIKAAIRSGDVEALKKAHNSIYANMRGAIGKTPLRIAQNLAVVDITIATREAIAAGLNVEQMYVIADGYILEVEDSKRPEDAAYLARACALRCTQLVSRYKHDMQSYSISSAIVMKAVEYMERNIYEKFDVEAMAAKLKVSAGYLSKLFKEEKKVTLGEYFRARKIEVAKILLRTTDKSIGEIALNLGFSSQSHFGRIFAGETGISPARFRNQYAVIHDVF